MKINVAKIERERERLQINKTKFASMVGITKQAYSDFLRSGSTTLPRLTRMATALGFDGKDFLTDV